MKAKPQALNLVRPSIHRMAQVVCLMTVLAMGLGSTGCSWFKKGSKTEKGNVAQTDYKAQDGGDKGPLVQPSSQEPTAPRPVGLRPATQFLVIYFDFDKSDIRKDQLERVEQNLKYLKDHKEAKVLVEGHCDERGTTEYNFSLGDRRARAVMNYFLNGGISQDRLQTLSKGEEEPVDPGHTEAAWTQNRRCEFKFFD
ncbi:peptidoglycan-associated lipoprotein Pal [Candidatus Sumerlaeota bacterium]|nr:peptidoglycan-associated lipoprotein Pal [Candidatus Sumerlaeota bacterium]